jgi:ABC-type amino acid transport substrate-binding protein
MHIRGLLSKRSSHRVALVSDTLFVVCTCLFAFVASLSRADDVAADAQTIRVAVKPIEPFVITQSEKLSGFSIDVWKDISREIGVKTEYVVVTAVPDLLHAVKESMVDAGIAAITITSDREKEFDFSHSFYRSGLRIAIPARSAPTLLATLGKFLSVDFLSMLASLVGLTLLTAHLLWLIERNINSECFPTTYFAGVGEAIWWSVATIITGGCENKTPVSLLGRLVAVAWMLGSIVLVATFTATLSSQMTTESIAGVITGPDGLPSRTVATVRGTTVVEAIRESQAIAVPCDTIDLAISAVANGKAEAVVFDAPVLAYKIRNMPKCPVHLVGPVFEHQDYGIALPTGSPLREKINRALLTISETGRLAELNKKWFGEKE